MVICKKISQLMNIKYLDDVIILKDHISRTEYKRKGIEHNFYKDYFNLLDIKSPKKLEKKNILIIDDTITDGETLNTTAKKIYENVKDTTLYAATGGIMAKRDNMTEIAQGKFEKGNN